jgi:hypothetical protein
MHRCIRSKRILTASARPGQADAPVLNEEAEE